MKETIVSGVVNFILLLIAISLFAGYYFIVDVTISTFIFLLGTIGPLWSIAIGISIVSIIVLLLVLNNTKEESK